ncbi:hypothetical protein PspCFBP13508_01890 [Pseudomonas sp. CFBP13508]|nr:hypothetical protein PspCFBP13508_01890 [Pseudomonas sp. CFBP13508]
MLKMPLGNPWNYSAKGKIFDVSELSSGVRHVQTRRYLQQMEGDGKGRKVPYRRG